jgi:beta-glucosidase
LKRFSPLIDEVQDMPQRRVPSSLSLRRKLKGLTLQRKVALLSGTGPWTTGEEPAIGLSSITMSDGPAGVRGDRWVGDTSVNIPSTTALAATWDRALVERIGRLLATEALNKGVDLVLAPTVNLHRTPFGGRHFECWSEDPLLTGELAAALVEGIQSEGVGACAKHFVANETETDRMSYDVVIDERTLRELYLAPFERLVAQGVWTVMAAYNSVNGHTMTESPLLDSVLRDEWGFDGLVVSDWTAVRSTVQAANAGTDLAMPGPNPLWKAPLVAAVEDGRVSLDVIDDKLERLLRLAWRVGKLDHTQAGPRFNGGREEAPTLTREAAAASFVLERNHGGLLPFDPRKLTTVAVIGPNAGVARTLGGGSAYVDPPYAVSPLDGIRALLGASANVIHAPGILAGETHTVLDGRFGADPFTGQPGVAVRLLDASDREIGRRHMNLGRVFSFGDFGPGVDGSSVASIEMSAIVVVPIGGEYEVGFGGIGPYSLELDGEVILEKELSADPAADHLEQALRPEQVTTTVTLEIGQPAHMKLRHERDPSWPTVLQLYVEPPAPNSVFALNHAVEAAKVADVAVVVVGTNDVIESEGYDRTNLSLPWHQDELVRAVAAVNPSTVVVVNAGAPVLMPWADDVPAILLTWFPGQEYGNALADVLFGKSEPGGRMPTTWWRDRDDLPSVRPTGGKLKYAEKNIGYRRANADEQVLVPFGHGLGYTDWEYGALEMTQDDPEGVSLAVTIRNTGVREGSEVVQLYASRDNSAIDRAPSTLAGFGKIRLGPGEAGTVQVRIPRRVFEHWDVTNREWMAERGTWSLSAGRSVTDIRLSTELVIG